MPVIISIAHQKGGVGKTTLTLNLFDWFQQSGLKCAIVDTDLQGSITHLYNTLKGSAGYHKLNLIPVNELSDLTQLKDKTEFDLLLLDTPPYLSTSLETIISISDYVLVPCKASPLDALAIEGTMKILESARIEHPKLQAGIVITMAIKNSSFNEHICELLSDYSVPVLKTMIGNRVDYSRSLLFSNGLSKNIKAQQEIEELATEILSQLTTPNE